MPKQKMDTATLATPVATPDATLVATQSATVNPLINAVAPVSVATNTTATLPVGEVMVATNEESTVKAVEKPKSADPRAAMTETEYKASAYWAMDCAVAVIARKITGDRVPAEDGHYDNVFHNYIVQLSIDSKAGRGTVSISDKKTRYLICKDTLTKKQVESLVEAEKYYYDTRVKSKIPQMIQEMEAAYYDAGTVISR
jgi:hypothetical protein